MPFKKADVVRLQQLSLSLIPNLCVLETFLATKQSDGFVMLLALALKNEGYADQGEITVISDGAECLKRLAGMLPQPVTHILDWFHISMKIQPLALLAVTAPKHLSNFGNRIERIKWRLWSEQAGRAHSLIARARRDLSGDTVPSIWAHRADQLLETLQIYIRRNKS
ncbi:hypothetical protein GTA62_21890, partial [Roseobacter sp. HKCCD9010]|nr:hypothetical protein [Roseobacter sp. HKCCD8474]NNW21946.1 hypothetical protein [Roseobacter sp. HKCCD7543]NNW94395.1 hypothetical protein [Roseobacter sp. HKCCD9063]NNY09330.1 hypothetical protein [Roseobacter sp. HKCCD9041]NNY34940.1 hypothetical protein [Roseobacter sp. HKCCD9010]NNY47791.1 hypothetical protein [Roseobacter sp. HKCCD8801]NNY90351.1 hypothetical protein [Roseobacter sp. HKCCD7577]NNZ03119.1 hypothetical protein [Roseobacter sp. HKCCD5862]NNZ62670.1 hypothetical protein